MPRASSRHPATHEYYPAATGRRSAATAAVAPRSYNTLKSGVTTVSNFAAGAQVVCAPVDALLGAAALIGFSSPVTAAEAAADEVEEEAGAEEEEVELEEVAVTGTRIQSPNVTASNPITS